MPQLIGAGGRLHPLNSRGARTHLIHMAPVTWPGVHCNKILHPCDLLVCCQGCPRQGLTPLQAEGQPAPLAVSPTSPTGHVTASPTLCHCPAPLCVTAQPHRQHLFPQAAFGAQQLQTGAVPPPWRALSGTHCSCCSSRARVQVISHLWLSGCICPWKQ